LGQPTENYLHSIVLDVLFQLFGRLERIIGPSHGLDGNGDLSEINSMFPEPTLNLREMFGKEFPRNGPEISGNSATV
jgi:hypothetical protein